MGNKRQREKDCTNVPECSQSCFQQCWITRCNPTLFGAIRGTFIPSVYQWKWMVKSHLRLTIYLILRMIQQRWMKRKPTSTTHTQQKYWSYANMQGLTQLFIYPKVNSCHEDDYKTLAGILQFIRATSKDDFLTVYITCNGGSMPHTLCTQT